MSEKLALDGGTPVRESALSAEYLGASLYGQEELEAIEGVINARSPFRFYGIDLQYRVKAFEKEAMSYFGFPNALAVSSGTASLVVALKAAGIGAGDKVIVPAVTFIATAGAVVCAGAVPVFCDVDDSLNMDPDKIEDLCDDYTKAVIVVPLLGNPCQMDKVMAAAKRKNLIVIEDVAQSMGCKFVGAYQGGIGDIGCFSLQLNKVITTGEGGMVVTENPKLYERAVRYHDQGMFREKEGFLNAGAQGELLIGQNYRMSELTGAVAYEQLRRLPFIIDRCKHMFDRIVGEIQDIPGLELRRIVDQEGNIGTSILAMLPTAELGERVRKGINAENITCGYLYGGNPLYLNPQIMDQRTADASGFPFNQFAEPVVYAKGMCPIAEDKMARNMLIQISPTYTDQDADDVVAAVKKVCKAVL